MTQFLVLLRIDNLAHTRAGHYSSARLVTNARYWRVTPCHAINSNFRFRTYGWRIRALLLFPRESIRVSMTSDYCSIHSGSHFSRLEPIMRMNPASIRVSVCLTGHRVCQSANGKSSRQETQTTHVVPARKAFSIEKSSVLRGTVSCGSSSSSRYLLLLSVCSNVSYDLLWIRATAISTSVLD